MNPLMFRTLIQMISPKLRAMKVNDSVKKQFGIPGYSIVGSISAMEIPGIVKAIVQISPIAPLKLTSDSNNTLDIPHEITVKRII